MVLTHEMVVDVGYGINSARDCAKNIKAPEQPLWPAGTLRMKHSPSWSLVALLGTTGPINPPVQETLLLELQWPSLPCPSKVRCHSCVYR